MIYKSCAKCGKIHPKTFDCKAVKRSYSGGNERILRSSYKWTKKSLEIREKANYLCEYCRSKGIYSYDDLEVHHIKKVTEDESMYLDNYNLVCLCVEDHKLADDGKIDAETLRSLAKQREES